MYHASLILEYIVPLAGEGQDSTEILEMGDNPNLHEISARIFIDHCKDMFGWSDLSRDVIMDVGCGEEGYCGKAILEKFPDVGAIIGIDSHPKIVRNFRLRTAAKIECVFADIEK
ncbi:hypothetical protein AVEN_164034-1, partial [Araneus ventricosus]